MTAPTQFPFSELTDPSKDSPFDAIRNVSRADDVETGAHRPGSNEFEPLLREAHDASGPDYCYTADDLAKAAEKARQDAERDTEAALRAAFAKDVAQRRCDLLAAIKGQLQSQESAIEQKLDHWASISQGLAVALAQAVIPKTIERHPLGDITDLIRTVMHRLVSQPSVELCVSSDLIDVGESLLSEIAGEVGFSGAIKVTADPHLDDGDIELRWQGGRIDRRVDRLQAEARMLADHLLEGPSDISHDDQVPTPSPQPVTEHAASEPAVPLTANLQMSEADDEH